MGLDCKLVIWDAEPPREIILDRLSVFQPIVGDDIYCGKHHFTAFELRRRLAIYDFQTSDWTSECWEDGQSRKWERIQYIAFWLEKAEALLRGLPDNTPVGIYHTDVEFD